MNAYKIGVTVVCGKGARVILSVIKITNAWRTAQTAPEGAVDTIY
jgi:hypothetical protein